MSGPIIFGATVLTALSLFIYFVFLKPGRIKLTNTSHLYNSIQSTLEESLKEDKGTGCDQPKLDPFAKEFLWFEKKHPPIVCDGKDWVKCYLSICKLDPTIQKSVKDIQCTYKDLLYKSDHEYWLGPAKILHGNKEYKLNKSDYVEISCKGSAESLDGSSAIQKWGGYAVGLRPVSVKTLPSGKKRSFNVLMLGFDSTSRNMFIRNMHKSYPFIKNVLNATILKGYNVAGDGTPAALFPILTGKTELEQPEWRKSLPNSGYVDPKAFIFYKLKEYGYQTFYYDEYHEGTFQARFNGFPRMPADHYFLPLLREADKKYKPHCIGDTPIFQLVIDLTDQFFKLDGKKFAFSLSGDITHDSNQIGEADESVVKLFKELMKSGVLKKTLVIIFGDHGARYGGLRNTLQGKLEERLPFLAIRLPDEIVIRRPDAQSALMMNADVLTTPHDIHATLLDAVDMREHWNKYKIKGADLTRGVTLLEPIPKNRSCSEAGIEAHWCACLKWKNVEKNDIMYKNTSQALLDKINYITKFARSQCAYRTLKSIDWVIKKIPNKNVVNFDGTKDHDAYLAKFTDNAQKIDMELYQIKITLNPGSSSYEATVIHDIWTGSFHVNPTTISRVNAYNKEPACISDIYPHLKPYCYCKTYHPLLNLTFFDRVLSNFM